MHNRLVKTIKLCKSQLSENSRWLRLDSYTMQQEDRSSEEELILLLEIQN